MIGNLIISSLSVSASILNKMNSFLLSSISFLYTISIFVSNNSFLEVKHLFCKV